MANITRSPHIHKSSVYETCSKCKEKVYCVPHVCPPEPFRKKCGDMCPADIEQLREKYPSFKEFEAAVDDEIHIYDPELEELYGNFLRYNPPLVVYKRKTFKKSCTCRGKRFKEDKERYRPNLGFKRR